MHFLANLAKETEGLKKNEGGENRDREKEWIGRYFGNSEKNE